MDILTFNLLPLLLFAMWQYQAFNEGKEEGMYYSCKYTSKNKLLRLLNEHDFWTTQRAVIASGFISQYFAIAFATTLDWISATIMSMILAMSYVLVFSYWHNGSLYITSNLFRNPENPVPYPGGWRSNPDGKAIFDFSYKTRLGMLIAGYITMLVFIMLNLRICGRI